MPRLPPPNDVRRMEEGQPLTGMNGNGLTGGLNNAPAPPAFSPNTNNNNANLPFSMANAISSMGAFQQKPTDQPDVASTDATNAAMNKYRLPLPNGAAPNNNKTPNPNPTRKNGARRMSVDRMDHIKHAFQKPYEQIQTMSHLAASKKTSAPDPLSGGWSSTIDGVEQQVRQRVRANRTALKQARREESEQRRREKLKEMTTHAKDEAYETNKARFRRRLHKKMDSRNYVIAMCVFTVLAIGFTIAILFDSSLVDYDTITFPIDVAVAALFTVDVLLRLLAEGPSRWSRGGMNIMDAIVVVIDWVAVFVGNQDLGMVKTLRLMRLVRLTRITRIQSLDSSDGLGADPIMVDEEGHLIYYDPATLFSLGWYVFACNLIRITSALLP
jgi:hypothetical protein